MSIRIYIEGGGPSKGKNAAIKCRQAFHLFFEQLIGGRKLHPIACGGRKETFDDFKHALANPKHQGDAVLLLVDSEMSIAVGATAKQHLRDRDGWIFPEGVSENMVHLMVQCMEAWFLADKDAIAAYYRQDFVLHALPGNPNIEAIPKKDVLDGLQQAARNTTRKGYNKGTDGFAILERLNAARVCQASPHAARLRQCLIEVFA